MTLYLRVTVSSEIHPPTSKTLKMAPEYHASYVIRFSSHAASSTLAELASSPRTVDQAEACPWLSGRAVYIGSVSLSLHAGVLNPEKTKAEEYALPHIYFSFRPTALSHTIERTYRVRRFDRQRVQESLFSSRRRLRLESNGGVMTS